MSELILAVLFVAVPFGLGARTRSYWATLVPLAVFALVIANHRSWEPSGDEIDVLHWAFLIGSGVAVPICAAGAAFGRRYRRPADSRS